MISGYPSALYDEHLADWQSLSLQVMNQAGVVTEKLWFNFVSDRVRWARFAGRNFTDRQRIKRKAANWGRRYQALPHGERLAVLAAMMPVDRISLREEFEECQKTFEHLRDKGRMNPEIIALLLLLKLTMAVFLEKTTLELLPPPPSCPKVVASFGRLLLCPKYASYFRHDDADARHRFALPAPCPRCDRAG